MERCVGLCDTPFPLDTRTLIQMWKNWTPVCTSFPDTHPHRLQMGGSNGESATGKGDSEVRSGSDTPIIPEAYSHPQSRITPHPSQDTDRGASTAPRTTCGGPHQLPLKDRRRWASRNKLAPFQNPNRSSFLASTA